jgi:hypothetical protein
LLPPGRGSRRVAAAAHVRSRLCARSQLRGGLVTHNRHVQMASALGTSHAHAVRHENGAPARPIRILSGIGSLRTGPGIIHGRPPSQLLAMMSGAEIGDFTLEVVTWAADGEAARRRNERLIRASDPESYRIFLSVTPFTTLWSGRSSAPPCRGACRGVAWSRSSSSD